MATTLPRDAPFVLLDDARPHGAAPARLYRDPVAVVATRHADEVADALHGLREATQSGLHAAGYLGYAAGHALEPRTGAVAAGAMPLLWFGLFRDVTTIAPDAVGALLPPAAGGWLGTPQPAITRADYDAAIARVLALIAAGDVYQANLTFQANVAIAGHPLALYAGLRARAAAGHGAVVNTGAAWLLSCSPELFFAMADGSVVTRPMKGTAPRGSDERTDDALAAALADDPKQRAENLMIVDLLRNDLSRIAVPGSVAVPQLFEVERYPTVQQMTSTVTALVRERVDALDVVTALFPCGSITGAPKIRAMQAIAAIEPVPRGVYTGAIGRIDAGAQAAAFNVAIRTLVVADGTATLGIGSGIVADSVAASEWQECVTKARFVASPARFDLIETMAFDPLEGILRLDAHLSRLAASAATFGFACDRHGVRNELQATTFRLTAPARVRLMLARSGAVAIEVRPLPPVPDTPVEVAVVPLPVDVDDFRLRHKTSDRGFYDTAPRDAGTFEVVFECPDGQLSEGSFTSLFVEHDGVLLTPPFGLPGVLRNELILTGRSRIASLRRGDLSDGFLIGNAVRGLLPARLVRL